MKDVRFLSVQVVAEIPEESEGQTLMITGSAAYKSGAASFSSTLTENSRSLELSVRPSSGEHSIPLSDIIPVKGILSEVFLFAPNWHNLSWSLDVFPNDLIVHYWISGFLKR